MTTFPEDRFHILILLLEGIAAHIIFNRLEPRRAKAILTLLLLPPTVTSLASLYFPHHPSNHSSALVKLILAYIIYLGTLAFSTVAYRLSPFHPLARFPGPVVCGVSRLWAWYIVWTGKQHTYYRSLHARYGTHVRTGPNHLHICDADAIPTVLGSHGFRRGERYDATKLHGTTGNLQSLIHRAEHAQRRRVWERGLNTSAVLGYQDLLYARINQLVRALEKRQGGVAVDLGRWLSCLAFDFMGDLAFGGAFKLMEQGDDAESYSQIIGAAARHQELAGAIPWVKPWHHLLPSAASLSLLRKFATESVLSRKSNGSAVKDIFYYLLDEEGIEAGPPSLPQLISESGLVIGAGSDTTGTTLTNLFFYLLSNPNALRQLQAEIDDVFPLGSEAFDPAVAMGMKFLNAVINETLRLQPAVPSGVQRMAPHTGAMVAECWVPGGTTVQISTYALHRDARYFSPDPDAFRPERWLEPLAGGYKLHHSAFAPFSYGPMNCVGKTLALQELRLVTCALLQRFDFALVPQWDPKQWESRLCDAFVLMKGELPVHIVARVRHTAGGPGRS